MNFSILWNAIHGHLRTYKIGCMAYLNCVHTNYQFSTSNLPLLRWWFSKPTFQFLKEHPPKCAWISLSFLCTSETTSCKQRHGGSTKTSPVEVSLCLCRSVRPLRGFESEFNQLQITGRGMEPHFPQPAKYVKDHPILCSTEISQSRRLIGNLLSSIK